MGTTRTAKSARFDDGHRAKIVERVRALLAMNAENGCTEAEAMTAADIAGRLMQQYDLTIEDIAELKREAVEPHARPFRRTENSTELHPAAKHCSVAVAEFFDCRVWRSGSDIVFLGMNDDAELAHDMLVMIRGAMDREVKAYRKAGGVNDGTSLHVQSTSYLLGMGIRISERLQAVKEMRSAAAKRHSFDLVVVKADLVAEAYEKHLEKIRMRKTRFQRDPGSSAAYGFGYEAGDRLALSQGEIARPAFDKRTPAERARAAYAATRDRIARPRTYQSFDEAPQSLSLREETADLIQFVGRQLWLGYWLALVAVYVGRWQGLLPAVSSVDLRAGSFLNVILGIAGGLVWVCLALIWRTMTRVPGGATVSGIHAVAFGVSYIAFGLIRR